MKYEMLTSFPCKIYHIRFDIEGAAVHNRLLAEFRERGVPQSPMAAGTQCGSLFHGDTPVGAMHIFYLALEVCDEYERRLSEMLEKTPVSGSTLPSERLMRGTGGKGGQHSQGYNGGTNTDVIIVSNPTPMGFGGNGDEIMPGKDLPRL